MKQQYRQLRDIARALGMHMRFRQIEQGSPEQLKLYQNEQLQKIVRHAASNSPYLTQLYRDIDFDQKITLQNLPVVTKRQMMANFDEWVTDPNLKLDSIERQIASDPDNQYYLGEYRIVATSGSTGLRGIFVYDRKEWSVVIAAAIRWAEMFGVSPLELAHKKLASIRAGMPIHATSRLGQSMDLGIRNLLMLDATESMESLVESLNEFQPELLMGYASMTSLLAIEQIEGRLQINPEVVATFSEMLSEDRANRVRDAWGITPFNHYGAAEQVMIAADCDAHIGLHQFADMSIIEIVDENNHPVPPGVPGHKVLLTNLHNFVQPLIRYEISDIVTEATAPCTCKRPFPLLSHVGGRIEDIIHLTGKNGSRVSISPLLIVSSMLDNPDVVEYQYSCEANNIILRVVPRTGSDPDCIRDRLEKMLAAALAKMGATDFTVQVQFVASFIRTDETMGKLKLSTSSRSS